MDLADVKIDTTGHHVTTFGDVFDRANYRGFWVVEFTVNPFESVSSSNLEAFEGAFRDFERRGVKLVGASFAAMSTLLEFARTHTTKIPIVELQILQKRFPEHQAVIRDTAGMRRCSLRYPHEVGFSVVEILRIIDALQTFEERKTHAPANWKPGDSRFKQPPMDLREIAGPEWYKQV